MRVVFKALSMCGLILTVLPAVLVLYGVLSWNTHALLMLFGAVLWFASAPVWMRRKAH